MKVAYTGWTWMLAGPGTPDEAKIRMFEQSVKEIAYLGYDVCENFAFISEFLPAETAKEICEKYGKDAVVTDDDVERVLRQHGYDFDD